jgi:hypothetical protein
MVSEDCELDNCEGNGALFGNGSIPNRCTYKETAVWNNFETAADFRATNERETSPSRPHMIERCRSVAILAQMVSQQRLRDGSHIMFINGQGGEMQKGARVLVLYTQNRSFYELSIRQKQTYLKLLHYIYTKKIHIYVITGIECFQTIL